MFTTFFISFGLAMDSFAASICGGAVKESIKLKDAFKAAFTFGVFQGGMPIIGFLIGLNFEKVVASFDHWIAFFVLSFIGGKMLLDSFKRNACDVDIFDNKTLITLSVATSIDALIIGMSFKALELNIFFAPIVIALVTVAFCLLGLYFGKKVGKVFHKRAQAVGGLILILIGIKVLIDHIY